MGDVLSSPWQASNFHKYFYLDRQRLLVPRIAMLLLVLLGIGLTLYYLADPNWHPKLHFRRVRGKGAIFVLLILLIVSLPAWLRAPLSLFSLGETFVYNVAMLVWTLDKRPDFAIGPFGIYGIDYLKYRRIPWHMVDRLEIRHTVKKDGTRYARRLIFIGRIWDPQNPKKSGGMFEPKIKVLQYIGVSDNEIIDLVKLFNPRLAIIEKDVSY